jgi:DNA (cytosine-5)-methyltransferase 1
MSQEGWVSLTTEAKENAFRGVLDQCFMEAEVLVNSGETASLEPLLGEYAGRVKQLGGLNHAAPGVILTLATYKICHPGQDITAHKDEHLEGFSARRYDTSVTVPFLIDKQLPRNVETHWLTQSFSFAQEFRRGLVIKTQPKIAGPLVVEIASALQENSFGFAHAVVTMILAEKIRIRNQGRVTLTRPKNLSIESTVNIVAAHLAVKYRSNAPRLPQLVIHAVYQCLVPRVSRYQGATLDPLARMKSADRKANTVGDIVVTRDATPFEAVETKYGQPIRLVHVLEAIDKVRALSVRRYYMLSTEDIDEDEYSMIQTKKEEFLKQNGCEIIVNGVVDSLSYYLRLLPDTTEFIFNYATHIETDSDTTYEHRNAWNDCCKMI